VSIDNRLVCQMTKLIFSLSQPLFLGKLLNYYVPHQTTVTKNQAYWYGSVILLSCCLKAFITKLFYLQLTSFGIKIRVACCSLTYRKSLKLRKNTLEEVGLGRIVNLMSNDLERFVEASTVMNDIWMAPIKFFLVVYFYSVMLTNHILTGIGVIIFYLLMQGM
jgi:ATP-binding cassette subfamily C (CFTR/MRP) protein 4